MSITAEVRRGAALPKCLHLWLREFLSYWGHSSEPKLWDKQWQNESRTVKWTPSLWPEDRKLLTWDTSCTCLLLSSLCWNSRHCQLHCHRLDEGTKCKLHYCVHVCHNLADWSTTLSTPVWLLQCYSSALTLAQRSNTDMTQLSDPCHHGDKSEASGGITWKIYSLDDEHIEVSPSHLRLQDSDTRSSYLHV